VQAGTPTGQVPSSAVKDLVIDSAGNNGISLLTSHTGVSRYAFGDTTNNYVASLVYNHSTNEMAFFSNNANALTFDASRKATFTSEVATIRAFLANSGNAAIPSYTFSSDPDTGMYKSADNELGFTTGGGKRLTLNSAGAIVSGDLSVSKSGIAAVNIEDVSGSGTSRIHYRNGATYHQDRFDWSDNKFKRFAYANSTPIWEMGLNGDTVFRGKVELGSELILPTSLPHIYNVANDRYAAFSAGQNTGAGANFVFYGGTHPTRPNDLSFRTNTTEVLSYDASSAQWTLHNGRLNGVKTLNAYIIAPNTASGSLNTILQDTNGTTHIAVGGYVGGVARNMFIANASAPPAVNPSGGGYMYALNGALYWRGSNGKITNLAAA